MAGVIFTLVIKTALLILDALDKVFRAVGVKPLKVSLENILWPLSEEERVQAADPLVSEPLGLIVKGCINDDRLTLFNRFSVVNLMRRILQTRAEITRTIKDNPDILATPIRKPVFIVGLPRSGTTFLHNLMAHDPQFRALRFWEMMRPCPPGGTENFREDQRFKDIATMMDIHFTSTGHANKVAHESSADSYEECIPLLGRVFIQIQYFLRIEALREFAEWFYERPLQDLIQRYEYHKLQLQIRGYQSMDNQTFLLKCPVHTGFVDAIKHVYPDVCFIFTYRRLDTVVASFCSTMQKHTAAWGPPDTLYGQRCLRMIDQFSNRIVSFKEQYEHLPAEKQPMYDLFYDTLVADPITAVRSIYDHFGLTLSAEAEKNMRVYLKVNTQQKRVEHRYSLEEYGLTVEDITTECPRFLKYYGQKEHKLI